MTSTAFLFLVLLQALLGIVVPTMAFTVPNSKSGRHQRWKQVMLLSSAASTNKVDIGAVLPILTPDTDTHGVLGQVALPVVLTGSTKEAELLLQKQVDQMHATLQHTQQTLGFGRAMAAPQVGISLRIIVMNLLPASLASSASTEEKIPSSSGRIALVNPEITWRSAEFQTVWDDCLSIPDKLVQVQRHTSISLRFYDMSGVLHEWEDLPPDLSELLQHEMEHLDGILMLHHANEDSSNSNIKPNDLSHLISRPNDHDSRRVQLANIQKAASSGINSAFTKSPLLRNEGLSDLFQTNIWLKDETKNPIKCFKGRGADYYLSRLLTEDPSSLETEKSFELVCASAGNWGLAVAYGCRQRGLKCTVFVPDTANPVKVAKLREQEANIVYAGDDLDCAKDAAKLYHADKKSLAGHSDIFFVEDGKDVAVTEGAGSIGVELTTLPTILFDAIIIPVGNGALINGIARWAKAASPMTKIIGIVPEGADSMYESWKQNQVVKRESVSTSADGLALRDPIPEAIEDMEGLVDDMVLVEERHLENAIQLADQYADLQLEPSGAASLAGLLAAKEQQPNWWSKLSNKNVAVIVTGANKAVKADC